MTELKLPHAMAELRPALGEIVGFGLEHAPYFSVLLSSRHGLTIQVDNKEEQVTELPPAAGTVLSAFDGLTTYERALGGFKKEEIQSAAHDLIKERTFEKYSAQAEPERRGDFVTPVQIDPLELTTQEKLDRCRAIQARAKGRDPRISNVRVTYNELNEHAVFADSSADLAQRVQRVSMSLFVLVTGPTGEIRFDLNIKSGSAGWEVLSWSDDEIQKILDGALALLSAERIEPGEYQIITAPDVSGIICHESFGHGVETDMFLKKRARAVQYMGRVVGSPLVNITDDPSLPGSYGSYFFDDEGHMAAPTHIVENGVFRRGITDRYSATALRLPHSANGRRQDYSRKAYARMSNTFFNPGTSTLEEMVAQVDHGIFLDKAFSGVEDPKGWGIQVTCHYGHEIRGGRLTERIFEQVGITGYVPDVLQSITAVSSELQMFGGICGKGFKEIVRTAIGGPHLLMTARLA